MNPANYSIPMLELYCEWLNRWVEADPDSTHRYNIHQFTIEDPEKYLYGRTEVLGIIPNAGSSSYRPRFMVVISTSDGDDGGPADLTAWFEVNEDNTTELVAMVQGFDTNLQFIYEDSSFKNLPT